MIKVLKKILGLSPSSTTQVENSNSNNLIPEDFDEESYLALNPDLQEANIEPTQHYLRYGCKEGRKYKKSHRLLLPLMSRPYDHDGLKSIHNHDFMLNKSFLEAYDRGVSAAGTDYQWYWRVHIGLWAAQSAARLPGDFVECGVNKGFLSSAIMKLLDWDNTGKMFYLLDTFSGINPEYISKTEEKGGVLERNRQELISGFYTSIKDTVEDNFSEWSNKKIIEGSIPETLNEIKSETIAFLHIDLNCSPPEVAAIEALWNRITPGGIVLLDDYAYHGYQPQKEAMDAWALTRSAPIASLPTGQGLIIKN